MDLENRMGSVSLSRVAWNTLSGGLLGAAFSPGYYAAPVGAAAGFGLTLYDELKGKSMNLSRPFVGALAGGLICSFFDMNDNPYWPNIITHSGLVAGGILGLLTSKK